MSDILSNLTLVLRSNRELLIQEWMVCLRKDPMLERARKLDDEALRDYIPKLIDDLVDGLSKSTTYNVEQGIAIGSSEAAKVHVWHRFEEGFALQDILRELAHLRAVILDLATRENVILTGGEAQLVHSAIDQVMNTAACEMSEMTAADLRHDVALRELFVAVLGHDLRNPIATIQLTIASLLKRKDVPDWLTQHHQRMARAADRMQRMVADLLDMTRIRALGGIPISRKQSDLRSTCEQIIEELGVKHADRTIEFEVLGNTRGRWDLDRIAEVVSNLVGNALDHSPPGTPIRVELRGTTERVVFQVSNEGAPISPEAIATIFEPFRREAQQPAVRQSEGLGLGLFIAKEIVKAHDGKIELTSNEQDGTTVTVALPLGT